MEKVNYFVSIFSLVTFDKYLKDNTWKASGNRSARYPVVDMIRV
jgi:hypothetical protein